MVMILVLAYAPASFAQGSIQFDCGYPKAGSCSGVIAVQDTSVLTAVGQSYGGGGGQYAQGNTSYAVNGRLFKPHPKIATACADGSSGTIAFAEHYAYKCGNQSFLWHHWQGNSAPIHRPTFDHYGDVVPETGGTPPVSGPSNDPCADFSNDSTD